MLDFFLDHFPVFLIFLFLALLGRNWLIDKERERWLDEEIENELHPPYWVPTMHGWKVMVRCQCYEDVGGYVGRFTCDIHGSGTLIYDKTV